MRGYTFGENGWEDQDDTVLFPEYLDVPNLEDRIVQIGDDDNGF